MEHPIGTLPRTPFCLFEAFHPQGSVSLDSLVVSLPYESSSLATSRGNERYEEKTGESYASCTTPAFPPFGGWRHHLPPHFVVGLWALSHGIMSVQESIECFVLPPA